MFWPPGEISLSEAYIHDDFDIEGEIEAVFPWPTTSSPGGAASPGAFARPDGFSPCPRRAYRAQGGALAG